MDSLVQARGKIARGALAPDFTKKTDRQGRPYIRGRLHVFTVDRFKARRDMGGGDTAPGLTDYKILLRPFYPSQQDSRSLEEQFTTSRIWSRIRPGQQVVFRGRQTDDARADRRDLEKFRNGEIEANEVRTYANLTVWLDRWDDIQFLNEPVAATTRRTLEALAEEGTIDREKIPSYMESLQGKDQPLRSETPSEDEDTPF